MLPPLTRALSWLMLPSPETLEYLAVLIRMTEGR